ncbi:MAG: DJ-1/PfpI family protein [Muribaculaceae bacterium]|nr:DJ-1/PfpI family protein [Muribaculaceae bacterium]
MKESFLFLADGFEEVEALTAVDVLRRAGMNVKTVSITSSQLVTGAHGITVKADVLYDTTHFTDPAWLILPGGLPGADNLHDFAPLVGLLRRQAESENGRIAAICAAPAVVLGEEGLLKGHKATCYPGFEDRMTGAEHIDARVVCDGKFVLGNGPASALKWALAIVAQELGEEKMFNIANQMLFYPKSTENPDNIFG